MPFESVPRAVDHHRILREANVTRLSLSASRGKSVVEAWQYQRDIIRVINIFRRGPRHLQIPLVVWACAALAIFSSTAHARQPEIRNINVRGLQIGAKTSLVVEGTDLLPAPRLFLDELAVEAAVDPLSTPGRLVIAVPLPETIAPGIGVLRLATDDGFSNSVLIGLDRLPQLLLVPEIIARPVALHGAVPGSGIVRTAFSGKAGEEVIIETEARRLGSKLRPVIHVYDSRRIQLVWGVPTNTLSGDSRVVLKLPRDDKYVIELHDLQYAPPGPSYFRLKVGYWQYADLAFPPAVSVGQETSVELLGNLAGTRTMIKPAAEFDLATVGWPAATAASGPAPSVMISSLPELTETANHDQPMKLPGIPVAVSGRLNAPRQKDAYMLAVSPGQKLTLQIFAEQIGSRIDAALELKNPQGSVLASIDDALDTLDPRLDFVVPNGLDAVEIVVRDTVDLAHDEAVYRLVVTATDVPQPNFDVTIKSDALNIPVGEPQVLEALVNRRGYSGALQLQLAGLPAGVTVQGNDIPAGANGALLTFLNTGEAPAHLMTRLKSQSADGTLVKSVSVEAAADARTPSWLRQRLALASTPKPTAPFQIAWSVEGSLPQLQLATKNVVPVRLVRPSSTFGPVRLILVTSQPTPRLNGQPNLPQTVRFETPVEVPINPAVKAAGDALATITKLHADARQIAATAQGDAKTGAEAKLAEAAAKLAAAAAALRDAETKADYQSTLSIVVPATLAETSCDVAVRAELLSPDRATVLRTAYTPVRRLNVLNPLAMKLTNPPAMEVTLDPSAGATVKLVARIERAMGYAGDVTVTFAGLPAGVVAANTVVKADQADFTVDIKIPGNFAAEEIKGVTLLATGPPDPLSGNLPVKSPAVDIQIRLLKPAK